MLSLSSTPGPEQSRPGLVSPSTPSRFPVRMGRSGRSFSNLVLLSGSFCQWVYNHSPMNVISSSDSWENVCFCGLCCSWSWGRWILCSTWTQTSYSCSRLRKSGPFFHILIRVSWLPWRQSTRSHASAGTTALPVTPITAKLESTQGSCSWTWHASGKSFSRYFFSLPHFFEVITASLALIAIFQKSVLNFDSQWVSWLKVKGIFQKL